MALKIGCSDLHYAIYTIAAETGEESWGVPVAAPGVMSININMNPSLTTAFFDDAPGDSAATLGNIEVELQKNELTAAQKNVLLGHVLTATGGLVTSGDDIAPEVAIGFKNLRSDGTYRYVWMLRGKFSEPEDNNATKGESVEFQSETITGRFMKLDREISYALDGAKTAKKKPIKYEVWESNVASAPEIAKWFTAVQTGATVSGT